MNPVRKNFEKSRKKYLTNRKTCGKIVNVPRQSQERSGAGRVPCKLNNVTNEKHQSSMSEEDMDMISCKPGFSQLPGLRQNGLKLR